MVTVVDYEAGNLRSVILALWKVGVSCSITQNRTEILNSERVIFPGVGAAGEAMGNLKRLGLDTALKESFEMGKPLLGICLGSQVILEKSEENDTDCLGLIKGEVKLFPPSMFSNNERLKVPHMGWNQIRILKPHPVFQGLDPKEEFYFVHAYYPRPASNKHILGVTVHGIEFPSVIGDKNLIAVQFHPEKSGPAGLRILKNFCEWDGSEK